MTLKELSQLYYLNREIEEDERRLEELESKLGPASPNLSGMPHGSGDNTSKTEKYAVEITYLKDIITAKRVRCIAERTRLEHYIASIDDSIIRLAFTLRFVDCLTWGAVADRIGGDNKEDSIKKACYRYLRKENGEPE